MPYTKYRKPSQELMAKRRKEYEKKYEPEIDWLIGNDLINDNKFLMDMLEILVTGKRPFSDKMLDAVRKSMTSFRYDKIKREERKKEIQPQIKKLESLLNNILDQISTDVKDNDLDGMKTKYYHDKTNIKFISSIKDQLETNLSLTKKQMSIVNKIHNTYMKGTK
tara:strand:+ start:344 stop:838 length:495 start_codon:yes stop_codon:yes gene_type:complete